MRVVPPTVPLKATLPAPLPIVSACAPSTLLAKVTSPPLVESVTSWPSVSTSWKAWLPVLRTAPFSVAVPFNASWLSAVVVPTGPSTALPSIVSAWPPAVLPSTPASVTVAPVKVVWVPSTAVSP